MSGSSSSSAETGPAPGTGLYIHVPFCRSLCPYCDFTIALSDPAAFGPLTGALLEEWRARSGSLAPRTIYFGGGTPTELPPQELRRLLRAFRARGEPLEATVEANPESLGPETLAALRDSGATRLSLGVQSTLDPLLASLGRTHSAARAKQAFAAARAAGFRSVSLDLMFGLPGQTQAMWEETLEEALSWGPDHVSCYALELSPGVPLARRIRDGRVRALPDEGARLQYEWLCHAMAGRGYRHYEISNFARPGHESLHNSSYWEGRPYLGLGPGAHSFDGRVRSWNCRPHREYVRRVAAAGTAREGEEAVGPAEHVLERLFLGLRTAVGLRPADLEPAGPGAWDRTREWACGQPPEFVESGPEGLRLSEAGFWYSSGLTADLAAHIT